MNIKVERIYNNSNYCISHIYANDVYVCDGIEDTDRGLNKNMPLSEIKKKKVYAKTAIPVGKYQLTINVISPKFSKKEYYVKFCGAKMPRVLDVPGFDGILIHRGNSEKDSAGCLIVGYNTIKGKVTNSSEAFEKLYNILKSSKEKIYIEYTRKYSLS